MATNKGKKEEFSAGWFFGGAAIGAGLWLLFRDLINKKVASDINQEVVGAMPPVNPPASFPTLASVAKRFDELKTLYHSDKLTPDQAIAQADGLTNAANAFSIQEGEKVTQLLSSIIDFRNSVVDFVIWKKEQGLSGGI